MGKSEADLRIARRRLSSNFRKEANSRKLTAEAAAQLSGIHENSVYRIWNGEDAMVSSYLKLCDALGFQLVIVPDDAAPLEAEDAGTVGCPLCNAENPVSPRRSYEPMACVSCKGRFVVQKSLIYEAFVPDDDA